MSSSSQLASIMAYSTLRDKGNYSYFALVLDNFYHCDDTSLTLVYGFDTFNEAKHYAITRCRQLIYRLLPQAQNMAELQIAWLQFGENVAVGSSGDDKNLYLCSDELWDHLIDASNGFGVEWNTAQYAHKLKICRVPEF